MSEEDLKPAYIHKVGLDLNKGKFMPFYHLSRQDIENGKFTWVIFLKREFEVNEYAIPLEDQGYLSAQETAFKLNDLYKYVLQSLDDIWEFQLFMGWLEGTNTAFDMYNDVYRDIELITGVASVTEPIETDTESSESTETETPVDTSSEESESSEDTSNNDTSTETSPEDTTGSDTNSEDGVSTET